MHAARLRPERRRPARRRQSYEGHMHQGEFEDVGHDRVGWQAGRLPRGLGTGGSPGQELTDDVIVHACGPASCTKSKQNKTHQHQENNMTNQTENNASQQKKNQTPETFKNICVRFHSEQLNRLIRDTSLFGKSIPELLRTAYFKGPLKSPLMAKSDQLAILVALNRIGNNINQIARQANMGFGSAFTEEFLACQEQFELVNKCFRQLCDNCGRKTN